MRLAEGGSERSEDRTFSRPADEPRACLPALPRFRAVPRAVIQASFCGDLPGPKKSLRINNLFI